MIWRGDWGAGIVRSDCAGLGIFSRERRGADRCDDISNRGAKRVCDDIGWSVGAGDGWGDSDSNLSSTDGERS
jgi:hypothetical protein